MAHADLLDDRIVIQSRFTEKDIVQLAPGVRWDNKIKMWWLPLTYVGCIQLREIFKTNLTVGRDLNRWARDEIATRVQPSLDLRTLLEPTNPIEGDLLRRFQRVGAEWLVTAENALLADDMGTGKTIQTLGALQVLRDRGEDIFPILAIVPNSAKYNWQREIKKWLPIADPIVVDGGAVKRRKALYEGMSGYGFPFLIINYESLRIHSRLAGFGNTTLTKCVDCGGLDPKLSKTRCEVCPRELNQIEFRTVILDEAHRIKEPKAKQTRAAWAICHQKTVTRRIALTGTPIGNAVDDLWSILHAIAPREFPVKSAFVDRYALQSWGTYGGLEVKGINPDHRDEFFKILDQRFRRVPKKLVLDQLPRVVRTVRAVDLSVKQRRVFNELEKQGYSRLDDGTMLVPKDDRIAWLRLIQLSSASLVGTDEVDVFKLAEPSSKLDALEELLDELGDKPVVVAAEHRQLIDLAEQRLIKRGTTYARITGRERNFERDAGLRMFQAGELRVMLMTMAAGSEALTMTAADTLIFLQRSPSLLRTLQTEGRIYRIGAEKHDMIHFIDIVAHDTREEKQIEHLHEKLTRLEEITRDEDALRAAGAWTDDMELEKQAIMQFEMRG